MNTNFLKIISTDIGISYDDFTQLLLNYGIQDSDITFTLNNVYFNVFDLQSTIQHIPEDIMSFI